MVDAKLGFYFVQMKTTKRYSEVPYFYYENTAFAHALNQIYYIFYSYFFSTYNFTVISRVSITTSSILVSIVNCIVFRLIPIAVHYSDIYEI